MKKILLGVLIILVSAFAVPDRNDVNAVISEKIDMLFLNCVFGADEEEYSKNAEELEILQISTTEETLSKYKATALLASNAISETFAKGFCLKSYVGRRKYSDVSLDAIADNAFSAAFIDGIGGNSGRKDDDDRPASRAAVTSESMEIMSRILGGCKPTSGAVGRGDHDWLFSSECVSRTDHDGRLVSIIAHFEGWSSDECARNLKGRMCGRETEDFEYSVITERDGAISTVVFFVSMPFFECPDFRVTVFPGGLVFIERSI